VPLSAKDLQESHWVPFHRLRLRADWKTGHSFVVSGALRHNQTGYSVVTPLQWAPSAPWVLVDRGWVPTVDGQNPPTLRAPLTKDWVIGRVYSPTGKRFTLGSWQLPSPTGVVVVQDWDFEKIAKLLKHPVMPFVLRLSSKLPGHYERQWSWIARIPPSRHLAYMFQWWALALVWLIGGMFLMRRKKG